MGGAEHLPEHNPQVKSATDMYEALQSELNDASHELPNDFLQSFAESDDPNHIALYGEFLALSEGVPEDVDRVLGDIDSLFVQFGNDTDLDGTPDFLESGPESPTIISEELKRLSHWTQEQAEPFLVYNESTGELSLPEGYYWYDRNSANNNWKIVPASEYADADNDGIADAPSMSYNPSLFNPLPSYMDLDGDGRLDAALGGTGITSTVAAAAGTSEMPGVEDAPPPSVIPGVSSVTTDTPPVEGTEAPDHLATDKGPETARLTTDQARELFLGKIGDYVEWDSSKTVMTISGMDKLATQVSRVNDFFGPDSTVMRTENPNDYVLHNKDKDYSWNEEHRTWIESGKTDYDDRLKVFNGTTVSVERKAVDTPAPAPTTPEPTEPTVPEAAPPVEPAKPEGMPDAPSKPTAKETREKEDKLAQSKEFSENLLNAEAKMAELEKQFDKVNRLDTKDVDEGNADRYQRELGELKKMRDAAGIMLTDLGGEFAGLQENGVFPADTPSTELRIARMDAMNTSFMRIKRVINHTLEDDKDAVGEQMHHRLTPREARDKRLDAEWKDETMPHINGLVKDVDSNMSVDGEADVDESGFRGNNKTLKLRYSTMDGENVTSVRRFDPEIKIRFTQVLPDDSYSAISSNFQVKYKGKYYQTIDAAVTKAAKDFKALIDGPAVEPTPASAEPAPEPVAPADAPAKVEGKAAETDKDGTTDDADLETAAPAPGTVEATRKQTQSILKDVALLPTTRVVEGRRVPLDSNESGFTGIIKSPSGEAHNYLQHVDKDGYVDQRYVQLEGEGDWLAIPYSNFIEQEKAKDYEGIEADDPDKKDRHQYRPTDDAVWKNRHKGGRMTLTKRSE